MNTVATELVEALADAGLDTFFVVTGGAIAPIVDAVGRSTRCQYFCFQHEQGAAFAAEGYYRASGKTGVVLVTSGPGVQNIINGLCGCWYDSIPVLFITGQVNVRESLDSISAKPRQLGFQEMPVVDMVSSCSKFAVKVISAHQVGSVMSNALTAMLSDRRGPAVVDFPVNVQMEKIGTPYRIVSFVPGQNQAPAIEPELLDRIEVLLSNSQRPLVIVGNGIRSAQTNFLSWISIPFVSTWAALDIAPCEHPFRVGHHGVYGERVANFAVQNADLLIILGSRMDTRQTGGDLTLCSRASKRIMVDIDGEEMRKLGERGFTIDVPLQRTAESFIQAVRLPIPSPAWLSTIAEWKSEFGLEITREGNVYPFLQNLNLKLPEKCIIIPDQGGNLIWTVQSLRLGGGQRLFTNLGNSSMGWSLPAAIGAAIGTDGKIPIVCIEGDGGIQMNIQELSTLASLNLPVTVIVLNNKGYGIIRQFQDSYFGSRYTATSSSDLFGSPMGLDFVKLANAYGLEGKATDDVCITLTTPILYDVRIDVNQRIFPKLEFGNALENMTPYRTDLHKFMIVPPVAPKRGGWE